MYKYKSGIRPQDCGAQNIWGFEIQTDYLISSRQPDLVNSQQKKRTCRIFSFAVTLENRVKIKENEKVMIPTYFQGTKKSFEYEADDSNCNGCALNYPKNFIKRTMRLKNQRTSSDPPIYSIKSGQNSKNISGNMRRLAVLQIPVKDRQLTLE